MAYTVGDITELICHHLVLSEKSEEAVNANLADMAMAIDSLGSTAFEPVAA